MTTPTPTPGETRTSTRLWHKLRRGGPDGWNPKLGPIMCALIGLALLLTGFSQMSGGSTRGSTLVVRDGTVVPITELQASAARGDLSRVDLDVNRARAVGISTDGSQVVAAIPLTAMSDLATGLAATGITVNWVTGGVAIPNIASPAGAVTGATPNATTPVPATDASGEPVSDPSGPPLRAILLLVAGAIFLGLAGAWAVNQSNKRKADVAVAEAVAATDIPATTFADVAGVEEAVADLREIVDYLKDPERFDRLGAKGPRGALLVGPPGTGKTLLARAVAGEAGVAFFPAAGSDMVEMYVGVGARRIRQLFAKARKASPAIVFIDEIDAIARKRTSGLHENGNSEVENTLVALLHELDGFTDRSNVVLIAATNREDILDPALTRPGRLDRKISVPLPDRRGREHILGVHTRNKPIADDVDLARLARRTPGFSGAQLEAVANEAAIAAVRAGADEVTTASFDSAIATVAMGRARHSALVTDNDRRVTAWHEAGHTIAAMLLADAADPVAVSIVPRGPAGGVTWMDGSDDQFLSRARAHARLVVALAGRAGEQVLLDGEFTQGARGDLVNATELALAMVTQYGMSGVGLAVREQHLGGTGSKEVTIAVDRLLAQAHTEATTLLANHHDLLQAVAEALLEHEDLDAHDLARIAREHGDITVATPMPAVPVWTDEPGPTDPPSADTGSLVRPRRPAQPATAARPSLTQRAGDWIAGRGWRRQRT